MPRSLAQKKVSESASFQAKCKEPLIPFSSLHILSHLSICATATTPGDPPVWRPTHTLATGDRCCFYGCWPFICQGDILGLLYSFLAFFFVTVLENFDLCSFKLSFPLLLFYITSPSQFKLLSFTFFSEYFSLNPLC